MKTYTDAQIRAVLATLVKQSSYRQAGASLSFDPALLQRVVTGAKPITENLAAALGFVPCERKWTRK